LVLLDGGFLEILYLRLYLCIDPDDVMNNIAYRKYSRHSKDIQKGQQPVGFFELVKQANALIQTK